jgi:plasmid stability protein
MTAMATLTIRNLEDSTKAQLRLQAARHGRSMEEEARAILRQAVGGSQPQPPLEGVGSRIQAHFARLGGVELELPERAGFPQAPDLGEMAQ